LERGVSERVRGQRPDVSEGEAALEGGEHGHGVVERAAAVAPDEQVGVERDALAAGRVCADFGRERGQPVQQGARSSCSRRAVTRSAISRPSSPRSRISSKTSESAPPEGRLLGAETAIAAAHFSAR
jgi:hypothetical protein